MSARPNIEKVDEFNNYLENISQGNSVDINPRSIGMNRWHLNSIEAFLNNSAEKNIEPEKKRTEIYSGMTLDDLTLEPQENKIKRYEQPSAIPSNDFSYDPVDTDVDTTPLQIPKPEKTYIPKLGTDTKKAWGDVDRALLAGKYDLAEKIAKDNNLSYIKEYEIKGLKDLHELEGEICQSLANGAKLEDIMQYKSETNDYFSAENLKQRWENYNRNRIETYLKTKKYDNAIKYSAKLGLGAYLGNQYGISALRKERKKSKSLFSRMMDSLF